MKKKVYKNRQCEYCKKTLSSCAKSWDNKQYCNQSCVMKARWENFEQRNKISKAISKSYIDHPERIEEFRQNGIKQFKDPKQREISRQNALKGWATPGHKEEVSLKIGISNKKVWNTPEKKEFARQRRLKQVFPFKDTKIEIKVQEALKEKGVEFKIHAPILGQPDIFIEPNICIFCDGDYFHANPERYKSSDIMKKGYTAKQIQDKDYSVTQTLESEGYSVLRFWEHDINGNFDFVMQKIISAVPKDLGLLRSKKRG